MSSFKFADINFKKYFNNDRRVSYRIDTKKQLNINSKLAVLINVASVEVLRDVFAGGHCR